MDPAPRLAELLGSLSLATDQAAGLPAETAVRTSIVAVRLASLSGLQGFELADTFFAGLLRFLGCTAYAHEVAERYAAGDDLGWLGAMTTSDSTRPLSLLRGALRGVNSEAPLGSRVAAMARLVSQPTAGADLATAHCELAVTLARKLGMSLGVVQALEQIYERWDGRGAPLGVRGEALRPMARVLHVAWRIAAHHAIDGPKAALFTIAERSGREFDPALTAIVARSGADLIAGLDKPSAWAEFLGSEPQPWAFVPRPRLDDIALGFAHYADVKSPYTVGHSVRVAELARDAAAKRGLQADA
ncbi:MAG TPA: HD domain-containing phosphohydrolase, partial [Polyangiaceae bacterium]|nr:HD domain-containing phosphohydrolase [Polyangiaceae bacterium]